MHNVNAWLIAGAIPAWALCQWWIAQKIYRRSLSASHARQRANEQSAAELLASARQQITELQKQLAAARLEVNWSRRHVSAVPMATPSEIKSPPAMPRPAPASNGFADTLPFLESAR